MTTLKEMCKKIKFQYRLLYGFPTKSKNINVYWCRLEYNKNVIETLMYRTKDKLLTCSRTIKYLFENSCERGYELETISLRKIIKLKDNTKKLKKLFGKDYSDFFIFLL